VLAARDSYAPLRRQGVLRRHVISTRQVRLHALAARYDARAVPAIARGYRTRTDVVGEGRLASSRAAGLRATVPFGSW
jgi:hypothetical protein